MILQSDELPFVSRDVVDYLRACYTPDMFIDADIDSNDERLGYMKGAMEVISLLDGLANRKD